MGEEPRVGPVRRFRHGLFSDYLPSGKESPVAWSRRTERGAAVTFLRNLSESGSSIDVRKALSDAADAIEKGEHRG